MKILDYIKNYYSNIFGTFLDNWRLARNFKRIRNKIKEANKRFLTDNKQYHVFEHPFKKGKYFIATHRQFEIMVRKNVLFTDLIKLSLYTTPQRLCDATIQKINMSDVESVANKIIMKLKHDL